MSSSLSDDIQTLLGSDLFDPEWYLEQYPDVALLNADAAEHYLTYGARLLRNPSPKFDTRQYLEANGDVAEAKMNPLLHYLKWGEQEGRAIYQADQINFEKKAIVSRDFNEIVDRIDRHGRSYAVVIPVFNAADEFEACIATVVRNTPVQIDIIVIDDASTDRRIGETLAKYERLPNIRILKNEQNLGFTRTVNKAIADAGPSDVILLNSDTKVTPNWSRNLRFAAYSAERIATATPFSDNAGAFSVPVPSTKNQLPVGVGLDQCARLVAKTSGRLYPAVPTGNGFCMFVRRDCLDQIGALDATAFPRGYGEENDFCMRATRAGWSHVIDDATFVHHVRSASFGDEKKPLQEKGMTTLRQRYPDYDAAVRRFMGDPIVRSIRGRIAEAWRSHDVENWTRPRLLFVVSTREGGTPLTNDDLMAALGDRYDTFLLRCDSRVVDLYSVANRHHEKIETFTLPDPIRAFPHKSKSYDKLLRNILTRYCIDLLHIRHIAWHSLSLPSISSGLDIPVVFSFHDFYTICPTVKLLDENDHFCAGRCTPGDGDCRQQIWPYTEFPRLKHGAIHPWQDAMREMLSSCDLFVTTSSGARQQILRSFPEVSDRRFEVIPHGRDLEMVNCATPITGRERTVRVLIAGNIDVPKGAAIIEAIGRYESVVTFEFHVLGETIMPSSLNVVRHGKYEREAFSKIVKEIRPHIGAIFSIWPETFCHTLTEMWSCGLPVLAIDRGAVGERIRAFGGGWLSPSEDPAELLLLLQQIAGDAVTYSTKQSQVKTWQTGVGRLHSTKWMSDQYDGLYANMLNRVSR